MSSHFCQLDEDERPARPRQRRSTTSAERPVSGQGHRPPRRSTTARELACRCMQRQGRWVIGLTFAGMAGFLAAALAISCHWLDVAGFLTATAASLTAFFGGLAVGHLGDPCELRRIQNARAAKAELVPLRLRR